MTDAEVLVPGNIVDGVVTHITKFGVFVRLSSGEEGLVHISEVADEFVTDIGKYVTVGEQIKVKILEKNAGNKYELSIKRTKEREIDTNILYKKSKSDDFEKKIVGFLKRAEEKQIDIRRNLKIKQGVGKKRKRD